MDVIVFEDEQVTRLYPITIGRPAYAISCGGYRLVDWLRTLDQRLHGVVRPHLAQVQQADFPDLAASAAAHPTKDLLLVNARLLPAASTWARLLQVLDRQQPWRVAAGDSLAAAWLPAPWGTTPEGPAAADWRELLADPALADLPAVAADLPLLNYPFDVIGWNAKILAENLEHRLAHGDYREVADGVFAGPGAQLGPYLVSDTSGGPVVLEENARVGPYCYLSGPAHLGRNARVIEHAAIKCGVCLGHTTKIGGEIEASVIEPFTNKQHHGFLGHSYLGSWINLGAGTCNSDLKNTYGIVKMELAGEKVDTGMQFVGCIMGDYAKTAINTGIFTGKSIGACSMVYGFVTTNVPSFVNYARLFGQVSELPPDVMVATQRRMFLRRNRPQRPCDEQLIRDMYQLTRHERHERQLTDGPLAL